MSIASQLNELCRRQGVTKQTLAKEIGVPQSTLQTWIARDDDFPARFVMPICNVLGIQPVALLAGVDAEAANVEARYLLNLFNALDHEGQVVVVNQAIMETRRLRNDQQTAASTPQTQAKPSDSTPL